LRNESRLPDAERIGHTPAMRGLVHACTAVVGSRFRRSVPLVSVLGAGFAFLSTSSALADPQKVWAAGAYFFSDELGGFRITGASGSGTRDDPLVITEELESATPVTLTIRTTKPIKAFADAAEYANGIMYMRIEALNNSGKAWVEFEFELQEMLGQPSVFGDGLSFDQRNRNPDNIVSSNYAKFDRNFEPYDRLLFTQGNVDPLKTVEFEFLMTDYTPRWTFYLVQDPRIPSS
jgi:hypothetical protein